MTKKDFEYILAEKGSRYYESGSYFSPTSNRGSQVMINEYTVTFTAASYNGEGIASGTLGVFCRIVYR